MNVNINEKAKKPFVSPEITTFGDIEVLTLGKSSGKKFDGNYVTGQPVPSPPNIFS